jgi:prolyl oligopeptidase
LYQQKTLEEKGSIFFDPNSLSSDGTTSLAISKFSKDGKIFAYGLCEKGSDWTTIKVFVGKKSNSRFEVIVQNL